MRSSAGKHARSDHLHVSRLSVTVAALTAVVLAATSATNAFAATAVVNEQSLGAFGPVGVWSTADTRPGGAVSFVADATAPGPSGALLMTTDATTTSKAQLLTAPPAGTLLSSVTDLAYWSKTVSASFAQGAPSYQLAVELGGPGAGFTTLVFEPYEQNQGPVVFGTWQHWDVDAGQFWSTRTAGTLRAGGGGAPFYTLADVVAANPLAVVVAFGVNIGSNNPSYVTETDLLTFNATTYNFEHKVFGKDDCKNGGWVTNFAAGTFANQGACVSSFATGS